MKPIYSLNEIRGLAAIVVVCSHMPCTAAILGGSPGGYAVLIFYFLSGFLTYMSSERSQSYFLTKRIIKLVPLYYSVTIATYILASIKPEWFNTTEATIPHLIKSLLFIPYINSNGLVKPILDVGWYLSLEVFYYLVFWFSMKVWYQRRTEVCSFIFLVLYCIGDLCFHDNPVFISYKYGMITLIMGMYSYLLYKFCFQANIENKVSKEKRNWWIEIVVILAFYIGCVGYCYIRKHSVDVVSYMFFPCIMTLVFLLADCFLHKTVLQFVSKISLSMYLSHEFVVKGVSRLVYSLDELNIITFLVCLLCLGISLVFAYIVWYIIEMKLTGFLLRKIVK